MSENSKHALPKRAEIESKFKWKLEDIYDTNAKWEEDFKTVKLLSTEIQRFKGILGKDAKNLLQCLKICDDLSSLMEKVFVYARMRRDEDNANPMYQALTDRSSTLSTEVSTAVAFIVPEIISIPEDTIKSFFESEKELEVYKQFMDEILRQKEHTLSEREEEILAMFSEVADSPSDIYVMFNNADIKFPYVKDETGKEIELTKGRYIKFLENKDRNVRAEAFHAFYSTYQKFGNTLATSLASNVKKNRVYASLRNYGSALESSMDSDNVSTTVYDNLIETVNKNLHLLHRYLRLRKKALKLDELHMYDLYVPIVEQPSKDIPYEEALDLVQKGLHPLGSEYMGYLKHGFDSGWIDVFENEGKTSGAYSWGSYKTHPYVLLNYQGTINDVFTIAHEMGHALHSFYTNKTQHYIYSAYKILVAEVASTVNESILMRYMLENTSSKAEKAYLLNHYLEEFRGTVFRQVMFAEFEKLIHQTVESGEALTLEVLSGIYKELNLKYFGNEVNVDEDISIEWARIPHFYTSFYVYKYATGFSAATAISHRILTEGKSAVDSYIKFLSSGSSNYPLELLKITGVDLSTPQPVQDALNVFGEILDELEKLI